MKKLKRIFTLAVIMLASFLIVFNGSNGVHDKNYPKLALGLSHEESLAPLGLVDKADIENLKDTALDSSYSLLDDINIIVKNQIYDICYTCATLTMVETFIAKNYSEYYEFSPIHFATYNYIKTGSEFSGNNAIGGNIYDFMNYISSSSGPVLEQEMPLKENLTPKNEATYYTSNIENFTKVVSINKLTSFLDEESYSSSIKTQNRNAMKSYIKNNGSLIGNIDVASNNGANNIAKDSNGNYYLKKASSNSDHMISIIGWDDHYKVSDYSNAGAWLCQNSWGDNYTYFYVAYDDETITDSVYGILDVTLNSNTSHFDNYDSFDDSEKNDWTFVNIPYVKTTLQTAFTILDVSKIKDKYIKNISTSIVATQNDKSNIRLAFTDNVDFLYNSSTPTALDFSNLSFTKILTPADKSLVTSADNQTGAYGSTSLDFPCDDLKVTKKYIVILYQIYDMYNLGAYMYSSVNTNGIHNTYTGVTQQNYSSIYNVLDSQNAKHSFTIKVRLLTSDVDEIQNKFSNFTPDKEIKENGKTANNKTYYGNYLTFSVENATNDISKDNISIFTTYKDGTSFKKTDVTENFSIDLINNTTIKIAPKKTIDSENAYIVSIKIGEKDYKKVFWGMEKSNAHNINYNLKGGENHFQNYIAFTYDENNNELKLYSPTKNGYKFSGWINVENATLSLDTYTDDFGEYKVMTVNNNEISLEASWSLVAPTVTLSPTATKNELSGDMEIVFTYDGNSHQVIAQGEHALAVTYEWFYSTNNSSYVKYTSSTSNTLVLTNVDDSCYFYCKVTVTDGIETQYADSEKVHVIINPQMYDIYWGSDEYDTNGKMLTSEFNYNGTAHTVKLIGIDKYTTLKVTGYVENSKKNAGSYTAQAMVHSTSNNFVLPKDIETFSFKINKAKITINIFDSSFNSKASFDSFNDYKYEIVGTNYDNFDFNFEFKLEDTANESLKLIKLKSYTQNDNYEIIDNYGYLRLVDYELKSTINDYEITLKNDNGFILGTSLSVTSTHENDLPQNVQKYIEDKRLIVYDILDVTITDTTSKNINVINLKLKSNLKDKNVKVYLLTSEGLQEIPVENKDNVLTFSTAQLGQFVIVEAPQDVDLKSMIIALSIILIAGLFCCIFITMVRNHRNKKYYTYSTNAH